MINMSNKSILKLYGWFAVCSALVISFSSHADVAQNKATAANVDGVSVLKKIQDAAKKLDYVGVFVYQQEHFVRTSRISHKVDGQDELEKLEVLDGNRREYIRKNNIVTRYSPDAKKLLIEKRFTNDVFPAILVANTGELKRYYQIKVSGSERIAGLSCKIILLNPIDKLRYGYKLCSENSSGLLLQAQTLDSQHKVIEQIFFTQINIGSVSSDKLAPSFTNTEGWNVEHALIDQVVNLSNWQIKPPAGFKQVQAVKHVIVKDDPESKDKDDDKKEIWQIVFSDGLAAISVFIEEYDGVNRPEKLMNQGAMNIVGRHVGKYWVMVMGEAPGLAIRQVVNSIKLLEDE